MTLSEAQRKLEHYCAYQERSHREVREKLRQLRVFGHEADEVIARLITDDFLNEERFARAFARGKHRIRKWGRERIVRELEGHGVSSANIRLGMSEIEEAEYEATLVALAESKWHHLEKESGLAKRKKCCDYLLAKGYESDRVYRIVRLLESGSVSF